MSVPNKCISMSTAAVSKYC